MTDPTTPGVQLDFVAHWCPRHRRPYRQAYPRGVGLAMLRMFEAVVADPAFVDRLPKDAAGKAKTQALDAAMREHAPLCCWLGDKRMAAIADEALAR